ncbi:hypothetical protein EC988_004836, partial [Linderina pennispora]
YQSAKHYHNPHPYTFGECYIRHFGAAPHTHASNSYSQQIHMSQRHQQQMYQQQQLQQLYQERQRQLFQHQQLYQQHQQQVEQQQRNDMYNPQLSIKKKPYAQPTAAYVPPASVPSSPTPSAARPPPPLTEATGTAPIQAKADRTRPQEKQDSKYTDFDWSPFDSPLIKQCESHGFNAPSASLLENMAYIPKYSPTSSAIQSACNSIPHSPHMGATQTGHPQMMAVERVRVLDVESGEYLEPLAQTARTQHAPYGSQSYYR